MSKQTPKQEPSISKKPYHQFVDRKHPVDYRHDDIEALKHAIRAKENRLIVGIPGVGISNLLRFLVTRQDWGNYEVFFSYLNCDSLGDCLEEDAVFDEIIRQLDEQGFGLAPVNESSGYKGLYQLLTKIEGHETRRIVIVLNKAEGVLTAVNEPYYRRLKALSDLNKSVCYFYTATPQAAKTIDFTNRLFAGRQHYIKPFNNSDCLQAIKGEAKRLGVTFDPQTQSKLSSLVGGHPGLLRAVSSAVVLEKLDLQNEESILVTQLLTRSDVQFRCYNIWQALDDAEQSILSQIASGRPFSVDRQEHPQIANLQKFGLLILQDTYYKIFSPLFQGFVANQQTSQQTKNSPTLLQKTKTTTETELPPITLEKPTTIIYSGQEIVVAAKVLKGDQHIHLSALELKLLACLMQERKIYTKDAIAAYVYYEEFERGADIPDSLIENLVRQVRNRLGDKRYIMTHWGQGYEFIGY